MKRLRSSALVVLAGLVVGAAPRASAAPAVMSATASVPKMSSQAAILLFNPSFHAVRDDDPGPTPAGVTSYSESVGSHAEHPGGPSVTGEGNINQPNVVIGRLAADSSVSQSSTISVTPDSVVVGTTATATAQKTRTVQNCCFGSIANATTAYRVEIVLAAPCHYRLNGSISTDAATGGGGRGLLTLSGNSPDPALTVALPLGSTASQTVSEEGVFDVGTVVLSVEITADLGGLLATNFRPSDGSAARASWALSLALSPDAPGSDVRWTNASGGAFGTDTNWDAQRVPTSDVSHQDNAVFDLHGAYAVDLGAGRSSDRLSVRQGAVTFRNGDLEVDDLSVDRPSLVVDVGKLILSGGVLTSNSATIGDLHGVGAEVQVTGAGTRWDCLGRLRVAGSSGSGGEGRLTIANGGTVLGGAEVLVGAGGAQRAAVTVDGKDTGWATGNIAVGYSSFAEMDVTAGAKVVSNEIHIGLSAPGSLGPICGVSGTDADGTPSEWDGSIFRVGPNFGVVGVSDGGLVKVGDAVLGNAKLTVSGVEPGHARRSRFQCASLTLGDAQIDVVGGGLVSVTTGKAIIGPAGVASFGSVNVKGKDAASGVASTLETDGELFVGDGDGGVGFLFAVDGAVIDSRTFAFVAVGGASRGSVLLAGGSVWNVGALIGIGGEGAGEVLLDASTITAVGGDVAANSVLRGNGTVVTQLPLVVHGTVAPGVVGTFVPGAPKRPAGPRATPVAPAGGTLTIDGDLVVDATGFVRVEAAGTQPDRLIVTGDATLDGTLVLQFTNGFAPKTGDRFDVLRIDGTVTGAFASVETRGLAPGAQFDVATTGGALSVTSTNDAVALPTVSVKASAKKLSEKKTKKKATLTFSRKGSTAEALTVSYAVRGTATNGTDYVSIPGVVTIPAKKKSAKATVQLVNDGFAEGAETIEVSVVPGADYTQSVASSARIEIVDPPSR